MNDKVDILYIINSLNIGGAQTGLCRLLNGLDGESYDITIVTLNGGQKEIIQQLPPWVTVINVDKSLIKSLTQSPHVIKRLFQADVIVGSLFHGVALARLSGLVNSDATVATWQHNEHFKTSTRRKFIELTQALTDIVLADSTAVANMFKSEFDVCKKNVKTVPIAGIQMENYPQKVHKTKNDIIVGSIGSLTTQKNYQTLVDIADSLSETEISFRIVGEGEQRKSLKQLIRIKEINNIELVGEVDDIPNFLHSVDIYIQPSQWEGLCITVIEAMAAGLPVVASHVGGIKYNVENGINGYLHDPGDIDGFGNSIRVLASNSDLRQQFGSVGRNFVAQNYTQNQLIEAFEDAILSGNR